MGGATLRFGTLISAVAPNMTTLLIGRFMAGSALARMPDRGLDPGGILAQKVAA